MSQQEIFRATQRTVAVILAGGRGKRLLDLTHNTSKPGVDFGGQYRIIDFTLSNCMNSNVRRVLVLTQYHAHRLLEHLQAGWTFLAGNLNEFVRVLPAQQSLEGNQWYRGTADAVYQNIDNLRGHDPEHVLVLAGDHIYKMDYQVFLEDHLEREADISVGCLDVPLASAQGLGIAGTDPDGWIVRFAEKPEDPPQIPDRPGYCLASMGIYLFRARFLFEELARDAADPGSGHDFGTDLIPALIPRARVFAHRFEKSHIRNLDKPPYWRDVGTIDAFWEANMDLTYVDPMLNLYDYAWPIFTHQEQLPAAKFVHSDPGRLGVALSSVVANGCVVSGASVRNSLLSSRVRVHSHAHLDQAVVLPGADIGEGARLRKVVVARDCRIPPGLVVGEDPDQDALRFHRTAGGVTLISGPMLDRLRG
ncbi:MAG: glucose-1-phosphate adenylyltransferase [Holophaga sp.]|jgi:glucose-1-phosphate adenylyltransferase